MTTQERPQRGLAYKWRVLFSVVFGIFMIILDSTVVNVALRTLQRAYSVSLTEVQWVISIYVLALGITIPLSGFLADRFGIKRIYVTGLALFVLGSLLCGLAPSLSDSIWLLVAARALQGIGGGMAQPLASAYIFSTFPPAEQGLALGIFGIALVLAPALGPIVGGALVDADRWQWIFFINVPIGLLGCSMAAAWLREQPRTRQPNADPLGLITAVIGFGALLLAATNVAELGWEAPLVRGAFLIGALGLLAFAVIELRVAREPLLDLRLFQQPTFLLANLVGYVSVLALFGAEFLMPLYLQLLRGRSALETGLILLPLAISAGIMTPLAGRLYDRIGPRPLVVVGYTILAFNTWQLARLQATTSIGTILLLLAERGVALGLTVQTTLATALGVVPRPALARGSSLINGTRQVVQSIGVALLATVLTSTLSPTTRDLQQGRPPAAVTAPASQTSSTTTRFGLCETPGVAPDQNLPPGLPPALAAQVRPVLERACSEFVRGFETTYRLTFYCSLLALLLGAALPGWPLRWAGRGAAEDARATAPAH